MKLVLDENIAYWNQTFSQLGSVVACSGREISSRILKDADALIVRSVTPVNQQLLEGSTVKFVGTCTIGCDHVDRAYLNARGIHFQSAAGCNAVAVAEYVLTSIFSILNRQKRILYGLNVGIIGYGNVGRALAERLKLFGANVVVSDPPLQREQESSAILSEPMEMVKPQYLPLEELLSISDIVSVHVPLIRSGPDATYHLINQQNIHSLSSNSILINAGRGEVVANEGLLSRSDLSYILDVWEGEPHINLELLRLVALGSSHIAGYSWWGKVMGTLQVYQALARFFHLHTILSDFEAPKKAIDLSMFDLKHTLMSNRTISYKNKSTEREAIDDAHYQRECLYHQIFQRVYDPVVDWLALKNALLGAPTESDQLNHSGAKSMHPFDFLRKHYTLRLQWNQVTLLHPEVIASKDRERLKRLGFELSDSSVFNL